MRGKLSRAPVATIAIAISAPLSASISVPVSASISVPASASVSASIAAPLSASASASALSALLIAAMVASGCAPTVDGPIERQRAIDREDGDRLAAQFLQLPGVVAASVVLHHAARDPLSAAPPSAATLSAVIATDDAADRSAIRDAALRLARAALPELASGAPVIEVHAAVHRPVLARVGPFWVEESSRGPLRAALALGCLAIAGLAGSLALRARRARRHLRGNSPQ
ncbi:MAG TPA: hypothetical protein VFK02_30175 [Kofleriaceae bacterium]|nr:hypothetical protein [Kofleriaceae bacterium]